MIFKPNIVDHKNFANMRKRKDTKFIVVHCSATENKEEYNWKTIDKMHRQRGWVMIGYHYIIKTDGTIEKGRDQEVMGAHAKGYNDHSISVCLIGGVDSQGKSVDNFTDAQKSSLRKLLDWLKSEYLEAEVLGHRDLPEVAKDCPCFDVKSWYGVPPHYIMYTTKEDLDEVCSTPEGYLSALNGGTLDFKYGEIIRIS